ncbi:unnamed protein product [Pseudo-nitzschia multistriata]|uniref:CS domain-containing protein n=1 Tax=Pseudo-nitzschia multistriata TaxID=183589 RepID=A0A448ZRJ6_9STRA|nr:unnamed protein product [Pseudo-nitzschia multistriata]
MSSTNSEDEDRLNYLKDRGVEISTPEEREASRRANESSVAPILQQLYGLSLGTDGGDGEGVKFVWIPADESKAMKTMVVPPSFIEANRGDVMPNFVKPFFAADKTRVDAGLLQKQATKQFTAGGEGSSIKGKDGKPVDIDMSKISPAALNAVAAQGSVETFCLVHPADTNDYTGVYIYLDEVGMLKKLPSNKRASSIGGACGYNPAPIFYGDVFVARVKTKPSMFNVDFEAGVDTDYGRAEWMRRAVSENLAWQQAMNEATGKSPKLAQMEQPAHAGTDGSVAQESGFSWTQDGDEVEITVPMNAAVNKKEVKVVFRPGFVVVSYQGKEVERIDLYESVDVDGCTWTLSSDKTKLIVTCEKADPDKIWPRIRS